jgi:hypothetical protein
LRSDDLWVTVIPPYPIGIAESNPRDRSAEFVEADVVPDALPQEHTEIDHLLVADFAEVINGKSYVMGAGWDRFTPPQYPAQIKIGIAVGVRVPFLESNTPHHLTVILRHEADEYFRMEGDLETGRRPGARGESVMVPMAVNAAFPLAEPQTLELVAEVDGRSMRRISIRAEQGPQGPVVVQR